MIDTIFNVLDRDVNATTSIIREISSLFDGEGEGDKHSAVLEALNGFRVEVSASLHVLSGVDLNRSKSSNTHPLAAVRRGWDLIGPESPLARS